MPVATEAKLDTPTAPDLAAAELAQQKKDLRTQFDERTAALKTLRTKGEKAIADALAEREKAVKEVVTPALRFAERTALEPTPPLPTPEPSPPVPSLRIRPFGDTADAKQTLPAVINTLGLLAQMVTGMVNRTPVQALGALTGAMTGWREGQRETAELQWREYLGHVQQIREDNAQAMRIWEAGMEKHGANERAAQAFVTSALAELGLTDKAVAVARLGLQDSLALFDRERQMADTLFTQSKELDAIYASTQLKEAILKQHAFFQQQAHEDRLLRLRMEYGGGPEGAAAVTTLEQVPEQYRSIVKGLITYRLPLPSGFALRSPYWRNIISYAEQVDPSFDATQYNVRLKTRQDFATGKAAVNIRSLNTAVGHLDTLRDKAEKLENADVQFWNLVKNYGLSATGDPRVVEFEAAANAVESELASLFKGTGATDQEIKAWRASLGARMSPAQLRGAMATVTELVGSRLQALRDQYEKGTGREADFQILTGKSREILRKLGVKTADLEGRSTPTGETMRIRKKGGTKVFEGPQGAVPEGYELVP